MAEKVLDWGKVENNLRDVFTAYEKAVFVPDGIVDKLLRWLKGCNGGRVSIIDTPSQCVYRYPREYSKYLCYEGQVKEEYFPCYFRDAAVTFKCSAPQNTPLGFKITTLNLKDGAYCFFERALRNKWKFSCFKERLLYFSDFLKFSVEDLNNIEQVWLKACKECKKRESSSVHYFGWVDSYKPIIEKFKENHPNSSGCWEYNGLVVRVNEEEEVLLPFGYCDIQRSLTKDLKRVLKEVGLLQIL